MGLVDGAMMVGLVLYVLGVTILDTQIVLPQQLFPQMLVDFKNWHMLKTGDYFLSEDPPHAVVGLVWFGLIFQLPLAVALIYAIVTGGKKPWLHTTCLIFGSSYFTTWVAYMADFKLSNRGGKHLIWYLPFPLLAALAFLRGLFGYSKKNQIVQKKRD